MNGVWSVMMVLVVVNGEWCVQGCEHVELIPGGSDVAVNLSNVHDYVRKYAEYRMVKAVNKPLEVTLHRRLDSFEQPFTTKKHYKLTVQCYYNSDSDHFTGIVQDNLCWLSSPVKNWRILLEQNFTACLPLLTATSTFRLERRD